MDFCKIPRAYNAKTERMFTPSTENLIYIENIIYIEGIDGGGRDGEGEG